MEPGFAVSPLRHRDPFSASFDVSGWSGVAVVSRGQSPRKLRVSPPLERSLASGTGGLLTRGETVISGSCPKFEASTLRISSPPFLVFLTSKLSSWSGEDVDSSETVTLLLVTSLPGVFVSDGPADSEVDPLVLFSCVFIAWELELRFVCLASFFFCR